MYTAAYAIEGCIMDTLRQLVSGTYEGEGDTNRVISFSRYYQVLGTI